MFRNILMTSVAASMIQFAAKGALRSVEDEPEHIDPENDLNGGGTPEGDTKPETQPEGDETGEPEDDKTETVVSMQVYTDLPGDLPTPRAPSAERVNFGFKDWPIGGHALVPADLVARARGAIQNARKVKGVDNGKQFVTRAAKGLKVQGVLVYPMAKKDDIEVIRVRDKEGFKDGVAIVAAAAPETENA